MDWYKLSEKLPQMERKNERDIEDHVVLGELSHITEEYSYPVLLKSKNMHRVTECFYSDKFDIMVGRICKYTTTTKGHKEGKPEISVLICMPGPEDREIEVMGDDVHSYYFDKCFDNNNDIEWTYLKDL